MSDDAWRDRMENKLDSMAEAIVALARVEERLVTLFKRGETYDAALTALATRVAAIEKSVGDGLPERISSLEKSVGTNGQMLRFAERVFWIVVTAAAAFAFTQMKA